MLTGSQTGRLRDALLDAFEEDAFEMFLLVELDKRLSHLTSSKDSLDYRFFRVIRRADSEGWAGPLIVAAAAARPSSVALRDLAAEVGRPSGAERSQWAGLERIITRSQMFQDVTAWRARLAELEARVCRVEIPVASATAKGTGFLIAPDLVLTNYHVVKVLHDGASGVADARLRFDHKRDAAGTTVSPGTSLALAADWLVAWRPPSKADESRDLMPAPHELDYAVLRLASSASDRGHITLQRPGPDGLGLDPGHALIVLQHPRDEPLQMAFGHSVGLNGNKTRLRHTANTSPGSSGSPVLNARLELVALHHAGDPGDHPEYNAAIPVTAILDSLPEGVV
jgi:hypothetical protein